MKTKERVIVTCKPHWIGSVLPLALCVVFLLSALGYIIDGAFSDSVPMLVIAIVLAVVTYLKSISVSLELTESAIIGRIGIIKTQKLASPISKVQDISVSNGLFGKIFGYSTVCVSTAGSGGTEYVFKRVTNGHSLQDKFISLSK